MAQIALFLYFHSKYVSLLFQSRRRLNQQMFSKLERRGEEGDVGKGGFRRRKNKFGIAKKE